MGDMSEKLRAFQKSWGISELGGGGGRGLSQNIQWSLTSQDLLLMHCPLTLDSDLREEGERRGFHILPPA